MERIEVKALKMIFYIKCPHVLDIEHLIFEVVVLQLDHLEVYLAQ